jgi:glutamate dehydrogenase
VVPDEVQAEMLIEAGRLTVRATTWFLRSRHLEADIAATAARFAPAVETLRAAVPRVLDESARKPLEKRAARLAARGVPEALAQRIAACETLFAALDIVEIAGACERQVQTVAGVYFGLAAVLELAWLRERIGQLAADGHWQGLAKQAMRDDLAALQRTLAAQVLASGGTHDAPEALLEAWTQAKGARLARARALLAELRAVPAPDQAMLSVALRELRHLA